jgi:hypothetical protein
MAIYEHRCTHCDTLMRPTTKVIRGLTDVPVWRCPQCSTTETSAVSIAVYANTSPGERRTYEDYIHGHYRELPMPVWVAKTPWTAFNNDGGWTAWKEEDYGALTVC